MMQVTGGSSPLVFGEVNMNCIDISSYQNVTDFQAVKDSGIKKVIVRTILKNGNPDSRAKEYITKALAAGLSVDVYKYNYALTEEEARAGMKKVIDFLDSLNIDKSKCRIYDDMEWSVQREKLNRQQITNIVIVDAVAVENAGYQFGYYCNLDWYKNVLLPEQLPWPFWIARYPKNDDGTIHESLRPNVGEEIWQYSSKGTVPGISGKVDMNDWKEPVSEYYPLPQIGKLFDVSGIPASYQERKKIAAANGLINYSGTVDENMFLIGLWAQGKLLKVK